MIFNSQKNNSMAFNLDKLKEVAKPRSEAAKERAKFRKENREWLRMSQDIALSLHYYLRNTGMSQKQLAEKMCVSAVYVGKLLKGGENLTLETICKIQNVIGENIVSVAKPYVIVKSVKLSPVTRFSKNAVTSKKYRGIKMTQDSFTVTTGDAA
jgi:transcriptional regulator with XRE-family HTH domain